MQQRCSGLFAHPQPRHWLSMGASPMAQVTQTPWSQTWSDPQDSPHSPQLRGSSDSDLHVPLQQSWPPAQIFPQPPQLLGSAWFRRRGASWRVDLWHALPPCVASSATWSSVCYNVMSIVMHASP
jgi:hypothetical protein